MWEEVVRFYGDTLGLRRVATEEPEFVFEFGATRLWIDRVPGLERAEVWLEVIAEGPDVPGFLDGAGVRRRDEVEQLPGDYPGFWIENPAAVIHLVTTKDG